MQAKLEAALGGLANTHGDVVDVHICPGSYPGIIDTIFYGEPVGTRLISSRA
jgi:hypothetical protein